MRNKSTGALNLRPGDGKGHFGAAVPIAPASAT